MRLLLNLINIIFNIFLVISGIILTVPIFLVRSFILTIANTKQKVGFTRHYTYSSGFEMKQTMTLAKNLKSFSQGIRENNFQFQIENNEFLKTSKVCGIIFYVGIIILMFA